MTRPNKTFLRLTAFQRDRAPGHNVAQSAVAKWANSAYTQQIRVGEPMSMKRLFSRECIGQHSVSRRSFLSVTLGGLAAVGLGPTIAFSADENPFVARSHGLQRNNRSQAHGQPASSEIPLLRLRWRSCRFWQADMYRKKVRMVTT